MKADSLKRINDFIASSMKLDSLLKLIMEQSRKALNAQASSLALYDPKSHDLFFKVATGKKGEHIKELRLKMGQGITGACAKTKKTINVANVKKDKRWFESADAASGFKTRSILAVPMLHHGRLIGVIEVLNKRGGKAFNKADESLLETIGTEAALAIRNARLIEENLQHEHLAAIGSAITGLAHYIKNLMLGVSGGASLVDEALKLDDKELLLKGWRIVRRNDQRISELVRDMLYYSTAREPQRARTNITEVAEDVIHALNNSAKEKKVTLKFTAPKKKIQMEIDPVGIHRCLLNIVSNAVDAFRDKSGKVEITLTNNNSHLRIECKDNGEGIRKENIKRIFEPFYSTKGHAGTGIGLAVTHKIVQEHGGRIEIESKPGSGTTMALILPKKAPKRKKRKKKTTGRKTKLKVWR